MKLRSPLTAATIAGGLLVFLQTAAPGEALTQVPTLPAPAAAAKASNFDPEIRIDGIIARVTALQAGVGVTVVAGTYVRSGIIGGLGFSRDGLSGRIDGITRFHFDPFRQSQWAPYGGGGISGRFDRVAGARAYLLLLAGLDGPIKNGMTPSVELGLGGGARIGVILRRATAGRR
jgi:hypothetical protein